MWRTNKVKFPLFWKFSIVAVLIILVFGTVNLFLLWNSVYRSFEKEIDKRCQVVSSIIAEKVLSPIVYDDLVTIYTVLDEIMKSDSSIAYIFILDYNKNIIAHAPDMTIPLQLIDANDLKNNRHQIKVISADHYKFDIIRDIAFPIMSGDIGTVRLGIVEENIRKELNEATKKLLLMIFIFLIIGLIGAFYFSYLITSPIKYISNRVQNVDIDSILNEQFIEKPKGGKIFGDTYFVDELDILISKFNLMLIRLKENVSELKRTRDSFIQAEKLASIGTLTSGIGHEINNPISGIKNGINRILKDPTNQSQNIRYLTMIKEATEKIEHVVQQLLHFSREQDIILEPLEPHLILNDSLNLAQHKINKNDIEFEIISSCNYLINASANQLEQVFLNLLLNAIDAIIERKDSTPNYQGIINVEISNNTKFCIIKFKDNGTGVNSEIQSKVFDPFFTTKDVGKGTGLGLFVSIDIIKKHNGTLSYNSKFGHGAEFIIELPLSKE